MPPSTLANALASATATLALRESARLDAELLLAKALGQSRSYLFAWPERTLTETQARQFAALVARRAAGEPMAHILGRREFWSLDLEVTPETLIPRPETELLVELALALIPTDAHWDIADLGTGTGAIALAVATERPFCRVAACDVSTAALAVAERNACSLARRNMSFHRGHWYAPFAGKSFDIILSNPPYIRAGDPHLEAGDVRFEPHSALVAGSDGLDDLRSIIADAPNFLRPGGYLLVEHGFDQGPTVTELFTRAGFHAIATTCDLNGQPRVTEGRWMKKRLLP